MFRTRDFILIFVAVVFLVMAIGATLLSKTDFTKLNTDLIEISNTPDIEYEAVGVEPNKISRADRIASMREKIAAGGKASIAAPVEEDVLDEEQDEDVVDEDGDTEAEATGEILCGNYTKFTSNWSPFGLQTEVTEGARVYYFETAQSYGVATEASTSIALQIPEITKDVVLQLPVRLMSIGKPVCLYSDVIGIAQDGSLIRNSELGLYSVFGSSTLIGYALDGFPIYGVSGAVADRCGGSVVDGQYRYFLSDKRETIINCFSAPPARI